MSEYIYLLQEREFIKTKEPIYKIGKTKQENLKRLNSYPKGSDLILQYKCVGCDNIEKELIQIFKDKYIHRKDIGYEYFEGDWIDMSDIIFNNILICNKTKFNNSSINITIEEKDIITSYRDFIKSSNIKNIIITNKNTKEGYIQFSSGIWKKIWKEFSNDEDAETLELFISNNIDCDYELDNLILNICNTCYNKSFKKYSLKYNEFLVSSLNNQYNIIDTKTFSVINYITIANNNILTVDDTGNRHFSIDINNDLDIDIDIVDNILKSLINDDNILKSYKKLCHNILVEQTDTIVFYDYTNKCHLLSNWLNDLLFSILPDNNLYYRIIYDHSNKSKIYEQFILLSKPRVVFLDNYYYDRNNILIILDDDKMDILINKLKKLKVKNIIIKYKNNDINIYNIHSYIEYLIDNSNTINNFISNYNSENLLKLNDKEYEINQANYEEIFYLTNMLLLNYFKWCCSL